MENQIQIFLVDDHQIVIDGIRAMLLTVKDIKVVGTALTKEQLEKQLQHKTFDVLLLDINMPNTNGIEIANEILGSGKDIRVIMLSANTKKSTILAAVKAGVSGFLPKECSKEELLKAIRLVAQGNQYFGTEIAPIIFDSFSRQLTGKELVPSDNGLTEREIEVLRCFANGLSYKETAEELFISTRTVETHKKNIFQKLNINNHADLVKYAIRQGIIEL